MRTIKLHPTEYKEAIYGLASAWDDTEQSLIESTPQTYSYGTPLSRALDDVRAVRARRRAMLEDGWA